MEQHEIRIENRNYIININRKNVKNINLRVTRNLDIYVTASKKVPIKLIQNFIESHKKWIHKKNQYFEQFIINGNGKNYENGESFFYLGKQYRLKVKDSDVNSAKFYRGYLYLLVADRNDIELKKKIMSNWYREKAEIHFKKSLDKYFPKLKKYGFEKPTLKIRKMKSRWGSYSYKTNIITINFNLIKAPKYCLEYIILHELVHMRFYHHNKKFYSFLTVLMPDWRKRKELLDETIIRNL